MSAPTYISFRGSLALLIARVPIGLFFVIAGVKKVTAGVPAFVEASLASIPPYLPNVLGKGYLYALPFVEILVGALLIAGLFGRLAALVMSLILLSIMIAVTGIMSPPQPFNPNVIFLSIALALALTGPGDLSVDSFRRRKVRLDKQ